MPAPRLPFRRAGLAALLLAALLLRPAPARAGAWPQPEDGGQALFAVQPYQARLQGYDRFGRPSGYGWDRRVEGSVYWEHGLSPRWTAGMQPRLQALWMNQGGATLTNQGLAENKMFLRYTLWRGDWDVVAVQGQVSTPGIASQHSPRLAEPNASYEIRALAGHSFALPRGMSGFIDLQAAYNYRPGPPADEALVNVTAGLRFAPGWLALVQGISTIGMRNAGPGGPDYSIHRILGSVVVDLDERWLLAFGYMREVAGRRVPLGQGAFAALGYKY